MPSLLPHPPVLAHTIYQAISFDAALREDGFHLSGTSAQITRGNKEWKGVSDTVLGRSDWFNAWLHGEKQCTMLPSRSKFFISRCPDGRSFPPFFCRCYRLSSIISSSLVALEQYHTSLTSGDPWGMVDDQGGESSQEHSLRPTNSARRVKALFEQVTGQPILFVYLTPA
jgi:RAD50-interacting protein 1